MSAITIPQNPEVAGTVISNVRPLIPDAVYSSGVPQPDTDGAAFRVVDLYNWLTAGLRDMAHRCSYFVEGWWAMQLTALVNTYTLDARWHAVKDVFVNQYPCQFVNEPLTIYPSAVALQGSQPLTYGWHSRGGAIDISLWIPPSASDPTTTLNGAITATTDTIVVTSSTSFKTYGWLSIDNELIQYQNLGTNQVSAVRRGAAGTTAASHSNGATVKHCGLWVKGPRTPNPVTVSTDPLEVPLSFLYPLELYVLSYVRRAEQEYDEARALQQEYIASCHEILADPAWGALPGYAQVAAYGSHPMGGIFPLGPFGTVVP